MSRALFVRGGVGFHYTGRGEATAAQHAQVLPMGDGRTLALVANAYDSGFSACWPRGAELLLQHFLYVWTSASGSPEERLCKTFETAAHRFLRDARHTPPFFPGDEDSPAAALLAVLVENAQAHVAWIGGVSAIVARAFEAVHVAQANTLLSKMRAEGRVGPVGELEDVVTRVIQEGDPNAPSYARFALHPGDVIVLATAPRCFPDWGLHVAYEASSYLSMDALAKKLATAPFLAEPRVLSAVVALRVDELDLAQEIPRLVAEAERGDPLPIAENALACGLLPVHADGSRGLAIDARGDVFDTWVHEVRATHDPARVRLAMGAAARGYETLATLAPEIPHDAVPCAACSPFTGRIRGGGCTDCSFLGWVPEKPARAEVVRAHGPVHVEAAHVEIPKKPLWRGLLGRD